jgi:hypothetical protein
MSLVLPVIMVYLAEDRRELFTLCEPGRVCHAEKAASERSAILIGPRRSLRASPRKLRPVRPAWRGEGFASPRSRSR